MERGPENSAVSAFDLENRQLTLVLNRRTRLRYAALIGSDFHSVSKTL
jgi:hypothetical protein